MTIDSFVATSIALFPRVYKTVSSAYIIMLTSLQTEGRSLKYKQKSSGPKIDPCGTPSVDTRGRDSVPFTRTHWRRPLKSEWIQFCTFIERLYFFPFYSSIWCFMVSKAFLKSRKTPPTTPHWSSTNIASMDRMLWPTKLPLDFINSSSIGAFKTSQTTNTGALMNR